MYSLRLATWNVDTVDDEERRLKIFQELKEQNIDIACLQETKLLSHKYSNLDHTIFGLGGSKGKCPHGVGFAMKNLLSDSIVYNFNPDPHRLAGIKLELNKYLYIYIINVYAPTNDAHPDYKDFFYSNLEYLISLIPPSEAVFIIGDFNAQVGADNVAWPTCLGPYGVGKINANDNGKRLLEFCTLHDLCVLNTYTETNESEKFTHPHPDKTKRWSQLDLCITRVSDNHKGITTKPASLVDTFHHRMVILEINTSFAVQRIEPNLETDKLQTLLPYLLTTLVQIVITQNKTRPVKRLLESEKKSAFASKLFSGEIENASECIKFLKDSIDIIEKLFNRQDNIFPKDDIECITNSIINVSQIFLREKLQINGSEQALLLKDVQKYLTEWRKYTTSGSETNGLILFTREEKSYNKTKINKFLDRKQIDLDDGKVLKTLTIKWCEDFVLPEELLYISIYKQCMNIVNPTTTFRSNDLCSTLRHLMAQCVFTKFKAIVTDEILESHDIFICSSEKDMLFALNLLQEKHFDKKKPLYIAFIDMSQILTSGNKPTPVESLTNEDQWALQLPILCDNTSGNDIQLQSKLMKYLLSYILDQSFEVLEATLELKYNFHGKLFDTKRLGPNNAQKFRLRAIQCGRYAAIFATNKEEILGCVNKVENTCNLFGLSFLQNNPLVLEQNVQTTDQGKDVHIGSEQVCISKSVNFLSTNFTGKRYFLETDIYLRIHNACKSLQKLHIIVPKNTDLEIDIYFPDLKRDLEFLSLTDKQESDLNNFHARCLRRLKLMPKPDIISRSIRLARLALLGDYYRDKSDSITRRLLYGDMFDKRFSHCYIKKLEKDMESLQIDVENWETLADNEEIWKSKIETKL